MANFAWPHLASVRFQDGPLAGQEADAPARSGQPPLRLHVQVENGKPGQMIPGSEPCPEGPGWVSYTREMGDRRRPEDPWRLVLDR